MDRRSPITIGSWDDLRAHIGDIVVEINRDPQLGLAAAVNPFFALDELGYYIPDDVREDIGDRLRFSPKQAARRAWLRNKIFEHVTYTFDLGSPEALRVALYEDLALRPYPDARGCYGPAPSTHLPGIGATGVREPDPLEALVGRHPVIELLIEYRVLDVSRPGFASREAYEALRSGAVTTPVRSLRIRFKNATRARNDRGRNDEDG